MSRERYVRCTKGSCSAREGLYYRINKNDSITGIAMKYNNPSRGKVSGLATFELIDNPKVTHVICIKSSICASFTAGVVYKLDGDGTPQRGPAYFNIYALKWDDSDRYSTANEGQAQFLPFIVVDESDKLSSGVRPIKEMSPPTLGYLKEPTSVAYMNQLAKDSANAVDFISSIVTLK